MKRLIALLLTVSLVLLTGCQVEVSEEEETAPAESLMPESTMSAAEEPEPLSFTLPYLPDVELDPYLCPDGITQTLCSLVFEGLFSLRPDFVPENRLCSGAVYDPEKMTWQFTLKSGVSFSDGTPLTGDAVCEAFRRAVDSPRYAARFACIAGFEPTEDNAGLLVRLSRPNAALPALLDIPIALGEIGTGPYCLSKSGSGFILMRNIYDASSLPDAPDVIPLSEAGDENTLLYLFHAGRISLLSEDLTGADSVTVTGRYDTADATTTSFLYLCVNSREGLPLSDLLLRRRIWSLIDREQLSSAYFAGHAVAADAPIHPASPLYAVEAQEETTSETETADPQGSTPASPLRIIVNSENPFRQSAAEAITDTLTAAGIGAELESLPFVTYSERLTEGSFDLALCETRLTADWDLAPLLGSGGALNHGGWSSPATDQLMQMFAASSDRFEAAQKLLTHLRGQAPLIPLCFRNLSVLSQPGSLKGLHPTSAEPFYKLEAIRFD